MSDMQNVSCYVCGAIASSFKANLDLCDDCIDDYNEFLKYCKDTPNVKRKYKKYRKSMQNVVVESVEQARRRDTVKISWQIFSKAFEGTPEKDGTKSFNVGRSFMETIYFSIFTACRMSGYPVLIQDLIKHETLLFKESFMKRFYKNFQVFRSKTLEPLGFKMENLNVRAYIDILIRKLSPSIEQQKAIDVAYAMLGSEKILAQNFNVDYAYGNALSIKKIEPNVAAANVYYIATKHSQQEIAKALYITTVPIQRHYKQLVSLMGKITASKAAT